MRIPANSILWSNLSTTEKEWGIHPERLRAIRFDVSEGELSEELLKQLQSFFLGCRMATSDSDFVSKFSIILDSNEPLHQRVKTIVERTILSERPKENRLQKDRNGNYPISFEGEKSIVKDRRYIDKFAGVYNQLLDENKCHLMHPARYSELIEYLRTTFSNAEITADRLITYRCFGHYKLEILELKRSLEEKLCKRQEVQMKLDALSESGPNLIVNPEELQVEDLDCIKDNYCRKHVFLAYKELASQGQLEFLNLPQNELFDYQHYDYQNDCDKNDCDKYVHPSLAGFAKTYYSETPWPRYNFGEVVKYLKKLSNINLNVLIEFCLTEELERLTNLIDLNNKDMDIAIINYEKQLLILKKNPENYEPGDFSFLSDHETSNLLTNAYKTVEKLGAWPFFDEEPPVKGGYMFWNHPTLSKIIDELESDGHSNTTMGFTMRWMQRIRNQGWKVMVHEIIENSTIRLGVLNRTQLYS